MAHQVGVSEADAEPEQPVLARQQSVAKGPASRVSFDKPEVRPGRSMDRADSNAGNTRVSFDRPADLFVTGAVAEEPAQDAPEAGAGNTGTAKRKSKKKRDEVGLIINNLLDVPFVHYCMLVIMHFSCSLFV